MNGQTWTKQDSDYARLLQVAERLVRTYASSKDEVTVERDRFYDLRALVGELTGR